MIDMSDDPRLAEFILDYADFSFDRSYYDATFGADQVRAWIADPEIMDAIFKQKQASKRLKVLEDAYYTKQLSTLKQRCLENIINVINDKTHKDHVSVSLKLLQSDFIYSEAKAKSLGEKEADGNSGRSAPIIELVRKKAD